MNNPDDLDIAMNAASWNNEDADRNNRGGKAEKRYSGRPLLGPYVVGRENLRKQGEVGLASNI